MKEKLYNLLYKGCIIHKNLTAEECGEILQDLSEQFYAGEDIDSELIELKEV
jgi:hypothetical protein